jgi:hypothetical protein
MIASRSLAAAALFLAMCALAGAPRAEAEDAVALFERLVKPTFAPGTLTYATAVATGPNSLVLTGVVYTPARVGEQPQMAPTTVAKVTLDDVDFEAIKKKDVPAHLRIHIDGIKSRTDSTAMLARLLGLEAADLVKSLDFGKQSANISLDYAIIARTELVVRDFTLDYPGLLKLHFALDIDGIEPGGVKFSESLFDNAGLKSGSIVLEDRSLLAKAVAVMAKIEKKSEPELVAEWTALLAGTIAARDAGDQALSAGFTALLKDYRAPKGPLKIDFARPAGGRPIKDALDKSIVKTLGAKVTYAGKPVEAAPKP